jgi:hypothetical protein
MTEEEFEIKLHDEAKKKNIILHLDNDILQRSKTLGPKVDTMGTLKNIKEYQLMSKSTTVVAKK